MTAIDTRQFMALMAIAQHHGRPGTPTDQAHVEIVLQPPERLLLTLRLLSSGCVKQSSVFRFDLDSQAFAFAAADVHGGQFAALDSM